MACINFTFFHSAPERPKTNFTKDDAMTCAVAIFITCLESMKRHPVFSCGSATSLGIIELITQLLLFTEHSAFVNYCATTMSALWVILISNEGKLLKPEVYEGMWRNFHVYRLSSCSDWGNFIKSLDISIKCDHSIKLTYQLLIQSVFGKLMKERNNKDLPDKEPPSNSSKPIDKEEEKVLRYVAGYIPFALLKKYTKQVNNTAQIYCKFLKCWSVQSITSGRTFLTYTKEWIDAQNRGRLYQISDEVYLFSGQWN